MTNEPIRWGIVSTARIARGAFLPALRAAGGGVAYAVGGRDLERTKRFAKENGIEHAVDGYEALCADPNVDAIYVATPNGLHEESAAAALQAGKAVLCEKPLCGTVESTERLLDVARGAARPLWEAFVFLFAEQTARLIELVEAEAIGEVRQVYSSHHFMLGNRSDVRMSPDLEGGALQDVGCYSVRFARLVFGAEAESAVADVHVAPEGVDEQVDGVLRFPGGRTLLLSASMRLPPTQFARVIGTEGEIRLSNPFHASLTDTIEVITDDETHIIRAGTSRPTFTPHIEHIHAALRGEEAPRHLAVDEAMGNARAIAMLYSASGLGTPTA
jgi:predicted dehydrogenase